MLGGTHAVQRRSGRQCLALGSGAHVDATGSGVDGVLALLHLVAHILDGCVRQSVCLVPFLLLEGYQQADGCMWGLMTEAMDHS